MLEDVMRQFRVVEELVKARLEVDVPGLVQGVRARLESRLSLQPIPVAADLGDRAGPLGWGRVRTTAWEAAGFRKVVLSHVAMRPMIEGFALVLLPHATSRAPIFAADLMALPTRVSVNADVYGAADGNARAVLQPLAESFQRLGSGAGPDWASAIAAGNGLHAKVSPRVVDDAFAALGSALARYLDVATDPKSAGDATTTQATTEAQRAFFVAFHDHGPRKGPLGRILGADWAERYSRLIFE